MTKATEGKRHWSGVQEHSTYSHSNCSLPMGSPRFSFFFWLTCVGAHWVLCIRNIHQNLELESGCCHRGMIWCLGLVSNLSPSGAWADIVCVPKPLHQVILLAIWCKSLLNSHGISKTPISPFRVRGQMLVLSSGEVIGLPFFSLSSPPLLPFLLFLLFFALFPLPCLSPPSPLWLYHWATFPAPR